MSFKIFFDRVAESFITDIPLIRILSLNKFALRNKSLLILLKSSPKIDLKKLLEKGLSAKTENEAFSEFKFLYFSYSLLLFNAIFSILSAEFEIMEILSIIFLKIVSLLISISVLFCRVIIVKLLFFLLCLC